MRFCPARSVFLPAESTYEIQRLSVDKGLGSGIALRCAGRARLFPIHSCGLEFRDLFRSKIEPGRGRSFLLLSNLTTWTASSCCVEISGETSRHLIFIDLVVGDGTADLVVFLLLRHDDAFAVEFLDSSLAAFGTRR
jgi:hypothetical protein